MGNPLTAALAAMAVHTLCALPLGWPYPSVATAVAGVLGALFAVGRSRPRNLLTGSIAALAGPLSPVLPPAVLVAALSAVASAFAARSEDPLRNVAIAFPALTVLALALTP